MHQFIKNCAPDNASIILVSNKTEEGEEKERVTSILNQVVTVKLSQN